MMQIRLRNINFLYFFFLHGIMLSCTPVSKPINYGEDKCEYCRMSIVDQRFGSEIVTQKGKTYKFDAVECMIHYLDAQGDNDSKFALILTNTFDKPGELLPASDCAFLVSRNMPSPMGEYINPFSEETVALQFQEENEGMIYSWDELRTQFK